MSDALVKRLRNIAVHSYLGRLVIEEAADRIEQLTAERDLLREALGKLECKCSSNCDWERDDVCPSWIARAALKGERHD